MSEPRFVVQLHDATTLHFDLRLELDGVLRSWAVPKGPSLDPGVKRLAVPVPDHELAAGDFEGVHEGARRGSGAVIIWDEGTFELVRSSPTHLSFVLTAPSSTADSRSRRPATTGGSWSRRRMRMPAAAPTSSRDEPESVRSGRTWAGRVGHANWRR